MVSDFTEFLNSTPLDLYNDWLNYITKRDPLLQDRSEATFNSILAEAVASEFWIFIQLLKQKVKDSSILTAEGTALSDIVRSMLPEGRRAGTKSSGAVVFSRPTEAGSDITIPAGTVVAARDEDGNLVELQTDEAVTLEAGDTQVYANVTATKPGVSGNISTGLINIIRTPVVGISTCTNDAACAGGTDQEDDVTLRNRALYSIWVNGKATIPMIKEHLTGVEGVKEVHVDTLGQGDVLLIVDESGADEDEIDTMIFENFAAGCTAPGVLGASLRDAGDSFEIGDTSGAPVWVRSLQYCPTETEIEFTYETPAGATKTGTATFPALSGEGTTVQAELEEGFGSAVKILSSTYSGTLSFDIYMGKGTYPRLWVAPELQEVDINIEIVLTSTPEVGLLENIEASLEAKLASYMIGERLEYADLVKFIFVDFSTGRAFSGVDDVSVFELICKGETIDGFGQHVDLDLDERLEPGTINWNPE